MNILLPLLILAIESDVPVEVRYPEAIEVFHCAFDRSWDKDFDHWPDRWSRHTGKGFPRYVNVEIRRQPSPVGEQCLRIDVNGSSAAAYSPAVEIGPLYSYVLEGFIKTEGLKHDRVFFSLTLLGEKRQRLKTFRSRKISEQPDWKKVRLGPIVPTDEAHLAVIGVHLETGSPMDLAGAALFDDVWLGRLSRFSLTANGNCRVFIDPSKIQLTCRASGFAQRDPVVNFQVSDALGSQLARDQIRLRTKTADERTAPEAQGQSPKQEVLIGSAVWKPPISAPGFYRICGTMSAQGKLVHRREVTLAVIEPRHSPPGGQFGWSLPRGDKPLPLSVLGQLIPQVGINWLKYPLWFDEQTDTAAVARLVGFIEEVNGQGIEVVGMLHRPPESPRTRFGDGDSPPAAEIFAPDPKLWYPSLEPVMTRLATRVRWWQLGDDKDTSFVSYPDPLKKVAQVKAQLDRIGLDTNVGIGWQWMRELPEPGRGSAPWRFVTMSADPPLTHQELESYLSVEQQTAGSRQQAEGSRQQAANPQSTIRNPQSLPSRWVVLQPLSARHYSVPTRIVDLVRRMMTAKIRGAEVIFIPDPFDPEHGLLGGDGSPGELLLPWRSVALALGGAEYIGSIQLPGGSHNRIFASGDDVVMVVWAPAPLEETIYLGENVRQTDLWGREIIVADREHRQVIEVGPVPSLVTGLSKAVTLWRMAFSFDSQRMPSIFGRRHANGLRMKNCFAQGVSGSAELITPDVWMVKPKQTSFRLAEGESLHRPMDVTFPYNATSGRHEVRIDFQVEANRLYKFSVYRQVDVGLGDVYIRVLTQLNTSGELEVEQNLFNEAQKPANFQCQLFVPGRRRLATRTMDLKSGRDTKTYRLADGQELIGKTLWLRAVEMGGPRIFNYRFVAEK